MTKILKILLILLPCLTINASNKIVINFWHSMAGKLGNTLNTIIDEFNEKNDDFKIKATYKGTYHEALTSTVASYMAGKGPDIVQIFDIATDTMLYPKGVIKSVHSLLQEQNIHLPVNKIIKPVVNYYSDAKGRLLALPFNISTPALFYNKSAFIKAWLNPSRPPKTWFDVEIVSKQLIKSNAVNCGFTSTWIGWALFESFSLIHNIPFVTKDNGFNGIDVTASFNTKSMRDFIFRLKNWQSTNVFRYGGRIDDAQSLCTSQKCAMLIQSSGAFPDLKGSVSFELGMTRGPYLETYQEKELGNLIGGAAIWVLSTARNEKHRGIGQFFVHLVSPSIQQFWQNKTGYISVLDNKYLPKKTNLTDTEKTLIETQKFINHRVNKYRCIRLGHYMQIRDLIERQLEAVWAGYTSVDKALADASSEVDRMLRRFQRNVQHGK